jgi:hypothetical protein
MSYEYVASRDNFLHGTEFMKGRYFSYSFLAAILRNKDVYKNEPLPTAKEEKKEG